MGREGQKVMTPSAAAASMAKWTHVSREKKFHLKLIESFPTRGRRGSKERDERARQCFARQIRAGSGARMSQNEVGNTKKKEERSMCSERGRVSWPSEGLRRPPWHPTEQTADSCRLKWDLSNLRHRRHLLRSRKQFDTLRRTQVAKSRKYWTRGTIGLGRLVLTYQVQREQWSVYGKLGRSLSCAQSETADL